VLDRFFTVLTITPSFLVRFWPVKYRIEALIMFFRMVKERSVRFSFRSGQRSGQTSVKLGQPWSTLVKLGQTWSKLSELWEMYPGPRFEGFLGIVDPSRVRNGLVKPRSNLVNPGQTWSTLVKLREMCPGPSSWGYLMWRALVGSGRLGSGCPRFACRHPRKSRG
jgi:hypothetical protein